MSESSTEKYFVSIIIPAKNEEKMIGLCLQSIQQLNYPEDRYEVIVVDNGSTDRTAEIAMKYGAKVIIQPEGTISLLRNLGVKKSRGEILAFVDADCMVDKAWLDKVSTYFEKSEIGAIGSFPIVPENGTWVQKIWYWPKEIRPDIYSVSWLPSMNLLVKKEVFEAVNSFDESLITCEDVDLCYRISHNYKIISDKSIKVIHLGEASTLKIFFRKERWRAISNFKGVLKHGIYLKEIPSILDSIYYFVCWIFLAISIVLMISLRIYLPFALAFFFIVMPSIGISTYFSVKSKKFSNIILFSVLLFVYFTARAIALISRSGR